MMKNTDTPTQVQFETFLNVISNFQETFKFTHSEEFGLGQIFQNHFFIQNSSFWWKLIKTYQVKLDKSRVFKYVSNVYFLENWSWF